jgi:DNA helicase IV
VPQERDFQEEQQFLDRAYQGLEAMRAEATRMLQSVLDVGRGGTFQSRTERDIVVRTSMARLAQLDIGDQALCFGRIDRVPDPAHPEGESFHIGRLAVSAEDHEPLVVDWRAPVAEPFYRATGLDPQGLARRRHLAVTGRTVTGVEDEYFAVPGNGAARRSTPETAGSGEPRHLGSDGGRSEGGGPEGRRSDEEVAESGAALTDERLTDDGLTDEGLTLGGPGALLAALGHARTGHMADIVATIQREQDEIIRSSLGGVLMVQGGPGTGKTAVALHRAAYLLYTFRFPLERQGVLVVGPNPLFLRYIERVLPSLGETGVTLSTVSGLVPEIRVRTVERAAVARLKGEARMAAFIDRAVRTRQRPLARDLVVPFGATTLRVSVGESADIVQAARRRHGLHNARRRFVEHQLLRRLAQQYERSRRRAGVSDDRGAGERSEGAGRADGGAGGGAGAGGGDSGESPAELERQIRRLPAVGEALDRMWPRLSPHELLHDLYGARPLLAVAGRGILTDDEMASLYRQRSASLDQVPWTAADAALVDEARALLGPRRVRARQRAEARDRAEHVREEVGFWPAGLAASPTPVGNGHSPSEEDVRSFGHIVVDEAQDLSPMQLRMLARRSISGSMTVVGDIAQATGPWAPSSWQEVAEHLTPMRAPRIVELTVGYRTPAEVMEVAAGVLAAAAPGLTPPRPVRRSGAVPAFVPASPGAVADVAAEVVVGEMAAVDGGRTAVLAPEALLADVHRALGAQGLSPVDPRDAAGPGLAAPLVVLPAAESHGLEFDAVVVVEPAAIASGDEQGDWEGWEEGEAEGERLGDGIGAGIGEGIGDGVGDGIGDGVGHGTTDDAAGHTAAAEPSTTGLRALYVALTRPTRRLAVVYARPLPPGLRPV